MRVPRGGPKAVDDGALRTVSTPSNEASPPAAEPIASRKAPTHLFAVDGKPHVTLKQRGLLRELERFDLIVTIAQGEARAAVKTDDPVLATIAARRLQSIGAYLGGLARDAEKAS